MVHFFCHALYRCYQILISPSIVIDHIKKLEVATVKTKSAHPLFERLNKSFYCFALQEGMLEISERGGPLWPNIKIKHLLKKILSGYLPIFFSMVLGVLMAWKLDHLHWHQITAYMTSFLALALAVQCLTSSARPRDIWNKFGLGIVLILTAPLFYAPTNYWGTLLYAFSAVPGWFLGQYALKGTSLANLQYFNGLNRIGAKKTRTFILTLIILSGLPFSTTFIGEDILLAEFIALGPWMLTIILATFTINGLVCARLLCKVFFGYPSQSRL
jgi:hypothetical protein